MPVPGSTCRGSPTGPALVPPARRARDRCAGQDHGDGAHQLLAGAAGARVGQQLLTGQAGGGRRRAARNRRGGQSRVEARTSWWPAPPAPGSTSNCSPARPTLAPSARSSGDDAHQLVVMGASCWAAPGGEQERVAVGRQAGANR